MTPDTATKTVSPRHMPYMVMVFSPLHEAGKEAKLNNVIMPPVGSESKRRLLNPAWLVRIRHDTSGAGGEILIELRVPVVMGISQDGGHHRIIDLGMWDAYDKGVSRRHIQLNPTNDQLKVKDLESTNGSQLNGNPMDSKRNYALRPGDRLTLGHLPMRFLLIERPTVAGQPPEAVTRQLMSTGWL